MENFKSKCEMQSSRIDTIWIWMTQGLKLQSYILFFLLLKKIHMSSSTNERWTTVAIFEGNAWFSFQNNIRGSLVKKRLCHNTQPVIWKLLLIFFSLPANPVAGWRGAPLFILWLLMTGCPIDLAALNYSMRSSC